MKKKKWFTTGEYQICSKKTLNKFSEWAFAHFGDLELKEHIIRKQLDFDIDHQKIRQDALKLFKNGKLKSWHLLVVVFKSCKVYTIQIFKWIKYTIYIIRTYYTRRVIRIKKRGGIRKCLKGNKRTGLNGSSKNKKIIIVKPIGIGKKENKKGSGSPSNRRSDGGRSGGSNRRSRGSNGKKGGSRKSGGSGKSNGNGERHETIQEGQEECRIIGVEKKTIEKKMVVPGEEVHRVYKIKE